MFDTDVPHFCNFKLCCRHLVVIDSSPFCSNARQGPSTLEEDPNGTMLRSLSPKSWPLPPVSLPQHQSTSPASFPFLFPTPRATPHPSPPHINRSRNKNSDPERVVPRAVPCQLSGRARAPFFRQRPLWPLRALRSSFAPLPFSKQGGSSAMARALRR